MQLIAAQIVVVLMALAGVLLTVMTLPGAWIAIAAAIGCQFWQPGLYSWWTLGAAAGLAAIGEVLELVASAMGASKAGASKKGATGAVIGSIVGAIAGSFVVPIVGTIVGAVVVAGAVWWVARSLRSADGESFQPDGPPRPGEPGDASGSTSGDVSVDVGG